MWNKQRYCWQLQNHVWIQNFRRSNWKITMLGKSVCFRVMPRDVLNDIVSWQTRRLNNTTKYQLHALMTIISKKNWNPWESCQKYALKLFWNAYTWHVLEDRYYMVSGQTCTIDPKLDQSLWQTIISFDLLHSSYMWLQTTVSCGKNWHTMQIGTVSRLRFCGVHEPGSCSTSQTSNTKEISWNWLMI